MSIRKIGASNILTCNGSVLENHAVVLDSDNTILDIISVPPSDTSVDMHRGWIIPGFVNTHCHLELSHMKGMLPTGTGLIPFIGGVVTQRAAAKEVIQEAIRAADRYMWEDGIMAVGDISNTTDSFDVKSESQISYYTFIEAFDLMQPQDTANAFNQSHQVYLQAPGDKSLVPHAPYSCTPVLLQKINAINKNLKRTISIHNQETVHENDFFLTKTGELIKFYESFGLSVAHLESINKTSIHYLLAHVDPAQRYLLVHNTMTNKIDYDAALSNLNEVYWTTCANANLYIENSLPNYELFANESAAMTIGTDSLASNWQLSVWDELVTIKRYNSFLSNDMLFTWACKNGADALHLQDKLGSIEKGKSPGLLHIDIDGGLEDIIQSKVRPMRIV